MEKVKSKIVLLMSILLTCVLALFGCGDPYRNMKLSVDAEFDSTTGQYTKTVVVDENTDTFTLSATVSGAEKGVSTDLRFTVSSTNNAIEQVPNSVTKVSNTTTATFRVNKVDNAKVDVITSEGPNGGLKASVLINVVKAVQSMSFIPDSTDPQNPCIYVERGKAKDLTKGLAYTPFDTTQKDLELVSITDIVGGTAADISIDGNKLLVASGTDVRSFSVEVRSKGNTDVHATTKVDVVDLIDENNITLAQIESGHYTELEKNEQDIYTITLASNNPAQDLWRRDIYFRYGSDFAALGDYTVTIEDGTLMKLFRSFEVNMVDSGKENQHAEVTTLANPGTERVRFAIKYNAHSGLETKYIDLEVRVVVYPTRIDVYDHNGDALGVSNPFVVYDTREYSSGDYFAFRVYGSTGELIDTSSQVYIKVGKLSGENIVEDPKVAVYTQYDFVVGNNAVPSGVPYYVRHTYTDVEEISGEYYCEIRSATKGSDVKVTFPITFIRGNVSVQFTEEQKSMSLNTEQTLVLSSNYSSFDDRRDQLVLSYDSDLIEASLTDDGVLVRAFDRRGTVTLRLTSPNGFTSTINITIFETLETAKVRVFGREITGSETEVTDENVIKFVGRSGESIPLDFLFKNTGTYSSVIPEDIEFSQSSNNVVLASIFESNGAYSLILGNRVGTARINMSFLGFNEDGVREQIFYISFDVEVKIIVTSTNYVSNMSAYDHKGMITSASVPTLMEATYTLSPSGATLTTDEVEWQIVIGTSTFTLNYLRESSSEVEDRPRYNYDYETNTKQYDYTDSVGNRYYFVLDLTTPFVMRTYAILADGVQSVSYNAQVIITQKYTDRRGSEITEQDTSTNYRFTVDRVATVNDIILSGVSRRVENGSSTLVLTFDKRKGGMVDQTTVESAPEGNRRVIYASLNPSYALYKEINARFNFGSANDYFDVKIEDYNGSDYVKKITITMIKSIALLPKETSNIVCTLATMDGGNREVAFRIELLDGGVNNPYTVSNKQELLDIANAPDSNYILTNNIDFGGQIITPIGAGDADVKTFAGSLSTRSNETFTISNFTVNPSVIGTELYAGLFAKVGGSISNINIRDAKINVSDIGTSANSVHSVYIGSLAGQLTNRATLENVSVENSAFNKITDNSDVDIVFNIPQIQGNTYIGGVAGYASSATFRNVNARVKISATDTADVSTGNNVYVGAIAGRVEGGFFNNSVTGDTPTSSVITCITGNLTNTNSAIGGAFGYIQNISINNLNVTSNITGHDNVGGAIGVANYSSVSYISDVTVTVDNLKGHDNVGGLVGKVTGSIDGDRTLNIYNNTIQLLKREENKYISANDNIGGLIGSIDVVNSSITNNGVFDYSEATSITTSNTGAKIGGLVGNSKAKTYGSNLVNALINGTSLTNAGGLIGTQEGDVSITASAIINTKNLTAFAVASTSSNVTIKDTYACGDGNWIGNKENTEVDETNNNLLIVKGTTQQSDITTFVNKANGNEESGKVFYYEENNSPLKADILNLPIPFKTLDIEGDGTIDQLVYKVVPTEITLSAKSAEGVILYGDEDKNIALQYFAVNSTLLNGSMIRGFDADTSRLILDSIASKNTYKLSDILTLSVVPDALKDSIGSNIAVTSNSAVISVQRDNHGDYILVTRGVGTATITVSSILDPSVSGTIDIRVIAGIGDFSVNNNSITVVKQDSANIELTLPNYISLNVVGQDVTILLQGNNTYGVTILASESAQGVVSIDNNEFGAEHKEITLHNITDIITIIGTKAGNIGEVKVDLLTSIDGQFVSTGLSVKISIDVVNGTHGIYVDENTKSFTFNPWSTLYFSVVILTDKNDETLYIRSGDTVIGKVLYVNEKYLLSDPMNGLFMDDSSTIPFYLALGNIKISLASATYMTTSDPAKNHIEYLFRVELYLDSLMGNIDGREYLLNNDNYLGLDQNIMLNFATQLVGEEFTYETEPVSITMLSQAMADSSVKSTYYSYAQEEVTGENGDELVYNPTEASSESIVLGYTGMLTYSIRPIYANVDYFEITSRDANNGTLGVVTFNQLYKSGDNFYRLNQDIAGARGQRVAKVSEQITSNPSDYVTITDRVFDGQLYLAVFVGENFRSTNSVVITLYGYNKEGNVVYTKEINLFVVESPRIVMAYENMNYGVVAPNTTMDFVAVKYGFTEDIDFRDSTILRNGQVINSVLNNNFEIVHLSGNNYRLRATSVNVGDTIILRARATKIVEGRMLQAAFELDIKVATFVIDRFTISQGTDGVLIDNGYLHGIFGQSYPMNIKLYTTNPNIDNSTMLTDKANEFSTSDHTSFKYRLNSNDDNYTELDKPQDNTNETTSYAGFSATYKVAEKKYYLRNTDIDTTTLVSIYITYVYNEDGSITIVDDASTNGLLYKFSRTIEFGFNCYRSSDNEHPEPIESADQFLDAMKSGTSDYILMNDITLTNWKPIDTNVNSFDGNGYSITINSFDTSELPSDTTSVNAGIFGTIADGTIIKNVIIIVPPTTDSIEDEKAIANLNNPQSVTNHTFDLVADMNGHSTIRFGLLAGTNRGSVTNVQISYIAGNIPSYRGGYIDQTHLDRTSSFVRVNAPTEGVRASIGLLVGTNFGYITNSSVENVSIIGVGYVGGLVGENGNKISSSYFKGGNIQNQSTSSQEAGTGGLVAYNNANASITYSYALGREQYPDMYYTETVLDRNYTTGNGTKDISGIADNEKQNFAGSRYDDLDSSLKGYRAMNSSISANTPAGGFTYYNAGYITNSYSNILVNGSASAGFVYHNTNSGQITETYSLSSVRLNSTTHSPFTGRNTNGSYLDEGSIGSSYYLKLDRQPILNNKNGEETYSEDFADTNGADENLVILEHANPINSAQFANYTTFAGFAFNDTDAEEDILTSRASVVWFMPTSYADSNTIGNGAENFKRSIYRFGRPELVSANLKTISYRNYADDVIYDTSDPDNVPQVNYEWDENYIIGTTVANPYLIHSASTFDEQMVNATALKGTGQAAATSNQSIFTRMINDISYRNDDGTQVPINTYTINYQGMLDGNNMTISDIGVVADFTEEETKVSNITDLGLFAKITRGIVKNVNLVVESVDGSAVKYVGSLAGEVVDSYIFNVDITGGENTVIHGLNAVGGAIGRVSGKSEIVNVSANISAQAHMSVHRNDYYNGYSAVDTTYESYNTNGDNISRVSYVGGVIGIVDVTVRSNSVGTGSRTFGSRVRVISSRGAILTGENVGGLVGYLSDSSSMSNSYFVVDPTTSPRFYGTRSVGGAVAENHGTLDRVYIEHVASTQNTIDQYLKNNASRNNVYSTSNYSELFGYNTKTQMRNRNAHYVGGLVGINIGGDIGNSYSKVPVVSYDSLYAGGLVGYSIAGSITNSYTTSNVRSNKVAGGLVGYVLSTYNISTDGDNKSIDLYISNISDYMLTESNENIAKVPTLIDGSTTLSITGGVAMNTWNEGDITGQLPYAYVKGAFVGVINDNKSNDDISYALSTNLVEDRARVEDNYYAFITGLDPIGYEEQSAREINLTPKTVDTKNVNTLYTGGLKVRDEAQQTETYNYYLYKNLSAYASGRSYSEFVSRTLTYLGQNDWNDKNWNNKAEDGKIDFGSLGSDKIIANDIYGVYSDVYWDGINASTVGTDNFVTPHIKQETYKSVVYVYNEKDLNTLRDYVDSEFIIMNDIELQHPWVPMTEPFMGTLRSSDGQHYSISNVNIVDCASENVGFFETISGATLKDFDLGINQITAKPAGDIKSQNVGGLVGKIVSGTGSIIQNIKVYGISAVSADVTGIKDGKLNGHVTAINPRSLGGVIGLSQSVTIDSVTNEGLTLNAYYDNNFGPQTGANAGDIQANDIGSGTTGISNIGIGGIIGYANNSSPNPSVYGTMDVDAVKNAEIKPQIYVSGSAEVGYNSSIGGLIGHFSEATLMFNSEIDVNGHEISKTDIIGALATKYKDSNLDSSYNVSNITVDATNLSVASGKDLRLSAGIGYYSVTQCAENNAVMQTADFSGDEIRLDVTISDSHVKSSATTPSAQLVGGAFGRLDITCNNGVSVDSASNTINIDTSAKRYVVGGEVTNVKFTTSKEVNDIGGFCGSIKAIVDTVNIQQVSITGTSTNNKVGLYAGSTYEYSSTNIDISSNSSSLEITGNADVGALIGNVDGTAISDCGVQANITCGGAHYFGGLIGIVDSSSLITRCYVNNNYKQHSEDNEFAGSFGGAFGYLNNAIISNVSAGGTIAADTEKTIDFDKAGGFVSSIGQVVQINYCYTNTPLQTIDSDTLAGFVYSVSDPYSDIDHCATTSSMVILGDVDTNIYGFTGSKVHVNNSFTSAHVMYHHAYSEEAGNFTYEVFGDISGENNTYVSSVISEKFHVTNISDAQAVEVPDVNLSQVHVFTDTHDINKGIKPFVVADTDIGECADDCVYFMNGNNVTATSLPMRSMIVGASSIPATFENNGVIIHSSIGHDTTITNHGILDTITATTDTATSYNVTLNDQQANSVVYRLAANSLSTDAAGTFEEISVTTANVGDNTILHNSIIGETIVLKQNGSTSYVAVSGIVNQSISEIMKYSNSSDYTYVFDPIDVFYLSINENGTYKTPALRWITNVEYWNDIDSSAVNLDVNEINAYTVSDGEELYAALKNNDKDIVLTEDIDLSAKMSKPISTFNYSIEGNGHSILHLTMAVGHIAAFILEGDPTITNLGFEDGYVYSGGPYASGLMFSNYGTINKVFADSLEVLSPIGIASGLVDRNEKSITNVYAVNNRLWEDTNHTEHADNGIFGLYADGVLRSNATNATFETSYSSFKDVKTCDSDNCTNVYGYVDEQKLQNDDLGFDWMATWTRNSVTNDGTPILMFQATYWAERGKDAVLGTDVAVSGHNITIKTNTGLGWLSFWTNNIGNEQSGAKSFSNGNEIVDFNASDMKISSSPVYIKNSGGSWQTISHSNSNDYTIGNLRTASITIESDLDMNGSLWTPMYGGLAFIGEFNGNNKTISHLATTTRSTKFNEELENMNNDLALFNRVGGSDHATNIHNLKISNADFRGVNYIGGVVADTTSTNNNITLDNITVENSIFRGDRYIGGIGGRVSLDLSGGKITNNTVNGCTITATGATEGGAFAILNGTSSYANDHTCIYNNKVLSTTITGKSVMGGFAAQTSNVWINKTEISNVTLSATVFTTSTSFQSGLGFVVGTLDSGYITQSRVNNPIDDVVTSNGREVFGAIVGYASGATLGENTVTSAQRFESIAYLCHTSDGVKVRNFYTDAASGNLYGSSKPTAIFLTKLGGNFVDNTLPDKVAKNTYIWQSGDNSTINLENVDLPYNQTNFDIYSADDWNILRYILTLEFTGDKTTGNAGTYHDADTSYTVTVKNSIKLEGGLSHNMVGNDSYRFIGTVSGNGAKVVTLSVPADEEADKQMLNDSGNTQFGLFPNVANTKFDAFYYDCNYDFAKSLDKDDLTIGQLIGYGQRVTISLGKYNFADMTYFHSGGCVGSIAGRLYYDIFTSSLGFSNIIKPDTMTTRDIMTNSYSVGLYIGVYMYWGSQPGSHIQTLYTIYPGYSYDISSLNTSSNTDPTSFLNEDKLNTSETKNLEINMYSRIRIYDSGTLNISNRSFHSAGQYEGDIVKVELSFNKSVNNIRQDYINLQNHPGGGPNRFGKEYSSDNIGEFEKAAYQSYGTRTYDEQSINLMNEDYGIQPTAIVGPGGGNQPTKAVLSQGWSVSYFKKNTFKIYDVDNDRFDLNMEVYDNGYLWEIGEESEKFYTQVDIKEGHTYTVDFMDENIGQWVGIWQSPTYKTERYPSGIVTTPPSGTPLVGVNSLLIGLIDYDKLYLYFDILADKNGEVMIFDWTYDINKSPGPRNAEDNCLLIQYL